VSSSTAPIASSSCIVAPTLRTSIRPNGPRHFHGDRHSRARQRHRDGLMISNAVRSRKTPYRRTSVPCFQTEDIINDLLSLFGAQYEHRHPCMRRREHEEQGRRGHPRSICNLRESWSPQIRREKLSSLSGVTLRASIPCDFRLLCSAGRGRKHQQDHQTSGSFHNQVLPILHIAIYYRGPS
jgi:hypothetical protein